MDYIAARKHMVENQVRTNDVTDLRLLAALEATPREMFLPAELRGQAYVEREVAYAPGRRLLTARDFSKLIAAAGPEADDLVLDVACGTGYSTAILARLSEMVVAVESEEGLAAKAQENLLALGVDNAAVIVGDLHAGAANQGPFDFIFIGGVVASEPSGLFAQLKDGGRLAAIYRRNGVSRGTIWSRSGEAIAGRAVFDAAAAAVLPGFEAPKTFVF